MSDPVFQIYAKLLESEIAPDVADEVIARLQRDLSIRSSPTNPPFTPRPFDSSRD